MSLPSTDNTPTSVDEKITKKEKDSVYKEGLSEIHTNEAAFINTSQSFNRSLSTLVTSTFIKHIALTDKKSIRKGLSSVRIFEAMAASGIRSIRYLKEIPFLRSKTAPNNSPKSSDFKGDLGFEIFINDFNPSAFQSIEKNLLLNIPLLHTTPSITDDPSLFPPTPGLTSKTFSVGHSKHPGEHRQSKIHVLQSDAIRTLLHPTLLGTMQVIDLDPFGSPSEFVVPALYASAHNSLLCVTATDMITLCSRDAPLVYRRYFGIPSRGPLAKEVAMRLVVGDVVRKAVAMNKWAEPLLTVYCGFYVRVFLHVTNSREKGLSVGESLGMVWECLCCGNFEHGSVENQESMERKRSGVCELCGKDMKLLGPMWLGRLKDSSFVRKVVEDYEERGEAEAGVFHPGLSSIVRFVKGLEEEVDLPFYFDVKRLSSFSKLNAPPVKKIIGILNKNNIKASRCHISPMFVKADCGIRTVLTMFVAFAIAEVERKVAKNFKEECGGFEGDLFKYVQDVKNIIVEKNQEDDLFSLKIINDCERDVKSCLEFCKNVGIPFDKGSWNLDIDNDQNCVTDKDFFLTVNLKGSPKQAIGKK